MLREELGYDGLIMTDCMEMDAIADTVGTPEGAVRAVEAGCDLVTVSHAPEVQRGAIDAVVEAVRSGRIAETRIDASVRRVLEAKNGYDVGETTRHGERDEANDERDGVTDAWATANDECRRVGRRVAERGVTLVRDRDGLLPVDDGVRVVRFPGGQGSEVEEAAGDAGRFVESLRERGVELEPTTLDLGSPPLDVGAGETIVFCTRDAASVSAQAGVVSLAHESGADVAVLAIRNPYDLSAFPSVSTFLTTYDDTPAALAVAAEIVIGERDPGGNLPVTIPSK